MFDVLRRGGGLEAFALFNLGGWIFITVIASLFVVLAFRRESITYPRIMRWAVLALIASMFLPVLFGLLQAWLPGPGGPGSIFGIVAISLSPILFLSSIGLALYSLLPPPGAFPLESVAPATSEKISVTCPECAKSHQVPESYRGRRVACSGCGEPFPV